MRAGPPTNRTVNYDVGAACAFPGFKHSTGAIMGPRSLLIELVERLLGLGEGVAAEDQSALGKLVRADRRWCDRIHLSTSLAFWHVGGSHGLGTGWSARRASAAASGSAGAGRVRIHFRERSPLVVHRSSLRHEHNRRQFKALLEAASAPEPAV